LRHVDLAAEGVDGEPGVAGEAQRGLGLDEAYLQPPHRAEAVQHGVVQAAAEQEVTLLGVEILGPQELPVVVMQPGEGVARRCRVEVVEGCETANGEFGGVAHGEASHGFMGWKYGWRSSRRPRWRVVKVDSTALPSTAGVGRLTGPRWEMPTRLALPTR